MDFLFSFFGSFNRTQWWMAQLATIPISGFMLLFTYMFFSSSYNLMITATIIMVIVIMTISMAATVKRYHDRGKSGLWALIYFVPYIGQTWVFIECGFFPARDAPDRCDREEDNNPTYADQFTNEQPQSQAFAFGNNNLLDENKPKPLFGA